jgi:chromosome partitioning protein
MAQIVSIANQKGGVGKTSCVTHLAAALAAQHGKKTVLIDMDGQCNATAAVLARHAPPERTIKDVLWHAIPVEDVMVQAPYDAPLYLVAGSPELAFYEKQISPTQWDDLVQDSRLTLLGGIPDDVDIVLIDTPPTLGLWLNAALGASDGCVVVAEPNAFSVAGLSQLLATIERVKETVNPSLDLTGLILNKVRPGVREHEGFRNAFLEQFGPLLFDPPLALRVVIEECQRAGSPLEWYPDPKAHEVRRWFGRIAAQLLERRGLSPAPSTAPAPVAAGAADSAKGTSRSGRRPAKRQRVGAGARGKTTRPDT